MSKYKFDGVLDSGIYEAKLSYLKKENNDEMLKEWGNAGYELDDESILVRLDEKNPRYVTLYGSDFSIPIAWFYEEDVPYIDDCDASKDRDHTYTYYSKISDKFGLEPYFMALVLVRKVRYENLKKVRNTITYQNGLKPTNLLYLDKEKLQAKINEYINLIKSYGGIDEFISHLGYNRFKARQDFQLKSNTRSKEKSEVEDNYAKNYIEFYDSDIKAYLKKHKKKD